ncbi:MAG: hypothetical protein IJ481_00550, partial [Alphaproteobacteria bacterium]|nr:hypothetical protein [Alphaproteobacteria bacterium]
MSLYATEIKQPITIGSTPSVPTDTDYNYWLDGKTYVFNTRVNIVDQNWIANEPVTIDKDYTLKLINNCGACTLNCYNTFTNYGNV